MPLGAVHLRIARNKAQSAEIDIRAGNHGQDLLARKRIRKLECRSNAHRARGFGDNAIGFPKLLNRPANVLVRNGDNAVEHFLADVESQRTRLAHRRTVAENIHLADIRRLPCFQSRLHRSLTDAFNAVNPDTRILATQPNRTGRSHPAAADLEKCDIKRPLAGHHDFVGQRTLPAHRSDIIVRVNEGQIFLLRRFFGGFSRDVIRISEQNDFDEFSAEASDRRLLHVRSRTRHKDFCVHAEQFCRKRHPLGVIPRRGGDNPAGALFRRQQRHAIVSTAPFVRLNRPEIFAFDKETKRQAGADELFERRRIRNRINALACHQNSIKNFFAKCRHKREKISSFPAKRKKALFDGKRFPPLNGYRNN